MTDIMKKTICFLLFCLAAVTLQAQDRFSYSVEVPAGVGIRRGPLAAVTPEFVAQYELRNGFRFGAGVGIRFARPCLQYITRNGTHERSFCNELGIPLFLRLGYGKEKYFANVDAGYAICVLSFYGAGWTPGGSKDPCYDGFFAEPHAGMKFGRHSALALGVLLQQSTVSNVVSTVSGNINDSSYSSSQTVATQHLFTPAVTLRYVYLF